MYCFSQVFILRTEQKRYPFTKRSVVQVYNIKIIHVSSVRGKISITVIISSNTSWGTVVILRARMCVKWQNINWTGVSFFFFSSVTTLTVNLTDERARRAYVTRRILKTTTGYSRLLRVCRIAVEMRKNDLLNRPRDPSCQSRSHSSPTVSGVSYCRFRIVRKSAIFMYG